MVAEEVLAPGAFVLAILATNYALAGLPNVKLFDLLVFVAGYTLGLRRGALVAVAAWLVYDAANPWGPGSPVLLMTKIAGELGYVLAGVLVARIVAPERLRLGPSRVTLLLAVAAVATTLTYDVVTNLYTGYFWASIAGAGEYGRWIATAVFGPGAALFMVLHVGSNAVLFPIFGPLLMKGAAHAKQAWGLR